MGGSKHRDRLGAPAAMPQKPEPKHRYYSDGEADFKTPGFRSTRDGSAPKMSLR